jgi:hypothetical protein
LSGIIINKNLKLLLISCLARKVDVLFHFHSRSQYTWDRTYGRTVYWYVNDLEDWRGLLRELFVYRQSAFLFGHVINFLKQYVTSAGNSWPLFKV